MESEVEDVMSAFKMVLGTRPIGRYFTAKKYPSTVSRFKNVAEFLIGRKRVVSEMVKTHKHLLSMAVDYFVVLNEYMKKNLKQTGFRLNMIDSKLAKKLYMDYVNDLGRSYWEKSLDINKLPLPIMIYHKANSRYDVRRRFQHLTPAKNLSIMSDDSV